MPDPGDSMLDQSVPHLPLNLASGPRPDGAAANLSDYGGRWLVLYFYPKDSTPGCTTEGIDFNALLPKFKKLGATVLGVSRDSVKSHQNFCAKQGFKFDLVSDADETLCNAFGVIKEKNMYGRQVLGIERSRCPDMPRPSSMRCRLRRRSDQICFHPTPPPCPAGCGGPLLSAARKPNT